MSLITEIHVCILSNQMLFIQKQCIPAEGQGKIVCLSSAKTTKSKLEYIQLFNFSMKQMGISFFLNLSLHHFIHVLNQ